MIVKNPGVMILKSHRHQQAVIAYQREETKVLREMLGGKRLRFTDGAWLSRTG
jgi:hypothetical protein